MPSTVVSLVAISLLLAPVLIHAQPQPPPSPAAISYTPVLGTCPDGFTLVRQVGPGDNQTLSEGESAYVSARKSQVLPGAWKSYLANVQATKVSLPAYIADILGGTSNQTPTLGIAQSGGGLRAAIVGAGVMNALDGRNQTSSSTGTGGLLQAATYLTALSGGSWLTTSLAQADFPTFHDLIFGSSSTGSDPTASFGGWLPNVNIFQPTNDTALNTQYIGELLEEMGGKSQSGFEVTFTDMWSRTLARHFVNGTTAEDILSNKKTHGAGVLYSSIPNLPSFASHQQPFPIVLANTNSVNGNKSNTFSDDGALVPITNPIYEFNVYEMGSWDPMLAAFTPTKFLGTTNNSVCVTNFDQASLIEATSSGLFTQFNTSTSDIFSSPVGQLFVPLNATFPPGPGVELDSARYPNPFKGVASETYLDTNEDFLSLVDGGHDAENIPIQPLLVKARGVDVIFVIDVSSDDPQNFTNGRSMIATQNRTTFFPSSYSFPPVPSNTSAYVSQNLTTRPTFFGCSTTNTGASDAPLVIYVANGGPPPGQPPITNKTSIDFNYSPDLVQAMLDQSFMFATQGLTNATSSKDPQWPACLACAVVDRARERAGTARDGVCKSCFERYCWLGEDAASQTRPNSAGAKDNSAASRWAGQHYGVVPTLLLMLLSAM